MPHSVVRDGHERLRHHRHGDADGPCIRGDAVVDEVGQRRRSRISDRPQGLHEHGCDGRQLDAVACSAMEPCSAPISPMAHWYRCLRWFPKSLIMDTIHRRLNRDYGAMRRERDHRGDIMDPATRSRVMSRIRGRDTGPGARHGRTARRGAGLACRAAGHRPPGRPDFVLREYRVAVFVDGAFWHGWRFPAWRHKLSEHWETKIEQNRNRDRRNHRAFAARAGRSSVSGISSWSANPEMPGRGYRNSVRAARRTWRRRRRSDYELI